MGFTLDDLGNVFAFTLTTETLGPIRAWQIYSTDLSNLVKKFKDLSKAPTNEFIRSVISLTATHLNTDNERKEGEPITAKEAAKLSEAELETVSSEIIKHHTYLFEDWANPQYNDTPDNTGKTVCVISYPNLEIPRNEGETSRQYLQRLIAKMYERENQADLKSSDAFSRDVSILDRLRSLDDVNSRAALMFDQTINNISGLSDPLYQDSMRDRYLARDIPLQPNSQHKTNEILSDVSNTLASQKEVNEQTARSIEGLAKRSEDWETLFRESSAQSARQVRFSNRVAVISVIVAIISVLVAIYFGYKASSNNQNSPQVVAPASPETLQVESKSK